VVEFQYVYEGCQLVARRATNEDGTDASDYSLEYSYDSDGHMVLESTGTFGRAFDYSCWYE
jgi:hypothetical protein